MDEMLLLVKRGEGCDCRLTTYDDEDGSDRIVLQDRLSLGGCQHGSTVEEVNARAVRCFDCAGRGSGVILATGGTGIETTYVDQVCAACLGSGLRLEPKEEETHQPKASGGD